MSCLKIWEANLEDPAEPGPNKFKGMYFQGYLTEFEMISSADENVEVSLTFGVNGSGKRGDVYCNCTATGSSSLCV